MSQTSKATKEKDPKVNKKSCINCNRNSKQMSRNRVIRSARFPKLVIQRFKRAIRYQLFRRMKVVGGMVIR